MKFYYDIRILFLLCFVASCGQQSVAKERPVTNSTAILPEASDSRYLTENNTCHINFPKEQIHLAKAKCLSLPLSSQSWFQDYPRLSNGYIDLDKLQAPKDDKEFLYTVPINVPEYAKILGIIPYDDKFAWAVVASNRESEESEDYSITEQVYELFLFDRETGSIKNNSFETTVGIGSIDSVYEFFYDNPRLFNPPFNFKKSEDGIISYHIKDTLALNMLRQCSKDFTIDKNFVVTTHRVCYEFNKDKKSLVSDNKGIWKLNKQTMEFEEQVN